MKPEVSVIMNCYNGQEFLHQSLNSVLNQTYKNWELIFWDNQSTDESKNIFLSFRDDRFKYYYANKYTNLYKARNLAINKTSGKIITFIDTDDIWIPSKLEKQVNFFKNNKNAKILYSNHLILKKFLFFKLKYKSNKYLPSGKITNQLLKNYNIGWITVAIKKKIFKKKKKIFNEKLFMISDFDLMLRLSLKYNIFCIQEPLAIYRHHLNQLSRKKFFLQADHFLKWLIFAKKNIFSIKNIDYKNIHKRINLFKEIQSIKRGNFSLNKLVGKLREGEIKLVIKLLFFILLPNLFIKYIMSL